MHPRLQLRQTLQPLQQRYFRVLEMILEGGGVQYRHDISGELALVLRPDDVIFHEQDALDLLVGRGFRDVQTQRFLGHQSLGPQGEGGDQVLMAQIFAHAHHDPVGDGAQGLNSSTMKSGHSRLLLLNSAMMRLAMAVRASGSSSAAK